MKTGFFESISGNKSSSRLIAFIVIMVALIFAQEVIYFGKDKVIEAATAAGTVFLTVAGSAMGFMFLQKRTEVKQESNENPN